MNISPDYTDKGYGITKLHLFSFFGLHNGFRLTTKLFKLNQISRLFAKVTSSNATDQVGVNTQNLLVVSQKFRAKSPIGHPTLNFRDGH